MNPNQGRRSVRRGLEDDDGCDYIAAPATRNQGFVPRDSTTSQKGGEGKLPPTKLVTDTVTRSTELERRIEAEQKKSALPGDHSKGKSAHKNKHNLARFVPDTVARAPDPYPEDIDMQAKKAAARSSTSPATSLGAVAVAHGMEAPQDMTRGSHQAKGTLDNYLEASTPVSSKGTHGRASASAATPRVSNRSPSNSKKEARPQGDTKIGAVAMPGITTPTRNTSFNSAYTYTEVCQGGPPETIMEETPLEATLVADNAKETDVEAQVQERMRNEADNIADMIHDRIFRDAVVAEVQNDQSAPSTAIDRDEEKSRKRRKICIILLVVVLMIAGGVGAGVAVALSPGDSPQGPSPTAAPGEFTPPPSPGQTGQCSLCFDGSIPGQLDTNMVGTQTCAEYRDSQVQLEATDSDCAFGQAVAWLLCGCPTLPPAPANPTCTLCEDGESPLAQPNICLDLDTFVAHVGSHPDYPCDELVALAIDGGCACPGEQMAPPDTSDIDVFREVLVSISGDRLNDTESPQYRALEWIASEDPAETSVLFTDIEIIKRRYVAAVLYFALGGDGWSNKYNFLSVDDICTWNQNQFSGLVCSSSSDNVITLRFSDNGLVGTIPEEIGYFSSLGTIEMLNEAISGTLPSALSDLKLLSELDLTGDVLSGPIPDFLYTHAQLTKLLLDDNDFSGTISPSLGTSPRLEVFWLLNNKLSGPIPTSVGQSTVLKSVDLNGNSISGTIPEFSPSSQMIELLLRDNKLSGSIPSSLTNLTTLELFTAANNGLTGIIPGFAGNQGSLRQLALFANRLTGGIETVLTTVPDSLEHLELSGNELEGTLPTLIGRFTSLSTLGLFDNKIQGTIPTEVGMLTGLTKSFTVNENELTGTIPSEIGRFTMLGLTLSLHTNRLNGTLPTTLGNLIALENIYLFDNILQGTIPTELASCQNLKILNFGENQLDGDIGPAIDTLPRSLVRLDLDTNRLGGTIPTSIATFTNLDYLDLHINNLNGTIPSEFGVMTQLTVLAMSTNQFIGTVPSSLASLTELSAFYLLENNLSGSLDAFCAIDFDLFAANTCATDEIECSCCTHCCTSELSCTPI